MKQKIINLYQFKELSDEQQAKVLDKYRNFNDDLTCDLSEYNEGHILKLEEQGFLNPEISYSLCYRQGDGACFDCKDFNLELLLKDFTCKHKQWIINIVNNYCNCAIHRNSYANYYCHKGTRYFEINIYGLECNYKEHSRILTIIENINSHIESLRRYACDELEENLQADIDYLTSDEAIAEALTANEYYFNGETLSIEYV